MSSLPRRRFLHLTSAGLSATALGGCASARHRAPTSSLPTGEEAAFEEALVGLQPHALPPAPNASAFAARTKAAQHQLEALDVDALVITPSTNLRYFTGISWWLSERFFAWVLPRDQAPFLLVPAFEKTRTEERQTAAGTTAEIVTWREHENPYALLLDHLRTRGVSTSKVAVDPMCPLRFASGLRRALGPNNVMEGSAMTSALRSVKSDVELGCLRAANAITLEALRFVFARLRPGLSSDTIGNWIKRAQVQLGGQDPWALSLVGEAAAFPHGTKTAHLLEDGRGLLIDTGISVHGYQSDLSRTILFRTSSSTTAAITRFLDAHARVREAQAKALDAIRPGSLPADADAVARSHLAAHGYGPSDRFFTHRLGHGIGLNGHEAPYLVGGNRTPFAIGNTASCEPGVYVPGAFGIRVEDIFVVESNGAKTLGPPQQGPSVEDV